MYKEERKTHGIFFTLIFLVFLYISSRSSLHEDVRRPFPKVLYRKNDLENRSEKVFSFVTSTLTK